MSLKMYFKYTIFIYIYNLNLIVNLYYDLTFPALRVTNEVTPREASITQSSWGHYALNSTECS